MTTRMTWALLLVAGWVGAALSDEPIPHGQSERPGPALSPAEAIKKMSVPEGFQVEVVASEPDIVNPVAMTFDERGRIWMTESLEYPRREAGPGRDRVKVLEDTDGDGKADRFTVFAEGLNIPSGIAVGHGGVWVANAPDILYLQDTDGDGKADRREVVVSGFGRDDTHELPNSLTWGPDGWLYGWNGVFNASHVSYRGKQYDFTCAIFRIHPKTRDFELFCEGTSNPWGLAIDPEGSFFASACVIDHLWHLVETGYYHRQGGPYPPFTWSMGSIVDHNHQKAAYCGIHYFDSDAYPAEFRDRLYLGNIHGNCVNVDSLTREGSTYRGQAEPDFLSAHDAWFMPVVQKTGPDGCLYILDWYDRYHCYQDANRDPAGIDRLKGRLYRVRYGDTPRAGKFNLAEETDDTLIDRLGSPNVLFRDLAQRVLVERGKAETRPRLQAIVLDEAAPRKQRMHALWVLASAERLDPAFHLQLLSNRDATLRAWGVRSAGNLKKVDSSVRDRVLALARDGSADVQLQVAIAARKLDGVDPLPVLLDVLAHCGRDPVIPHVVWQNLHPLLEDQPARFASAVGRLETRDAPAFEEIVPRALERMLGGREPDARAISELFQAIASGPKARPDAARRVLTLLATKLQSGEIRGERLVALRERLHPFLLPHYLEETPLGQDAALVAASWKDATGLKVARKLFGAEGSPDELRLRALDALIAGGDPSVLADVGRGLEPASGLSAGLRSKLLSSLGKLDDPRVAEVVLSAYPKLEADLQPRAIELLTQRTAWSKALLATIGAGKVPPGALNLNQVRKLLASRDADLVKRVRDQWGTIREGRNPRREQVIAEMRDLFRKQPGDPYAGHQAFKKVCAQCHKIYGEGQDVGPDLTSNGRNDFDQLLSNVFDPSLVIGAAYQATTVATTDGRVLTGLLVEETPRRVVLKTQGGKLETVAGGDIDEVKVSPLSLMPEDLEKQLSPQELCDLFAFLALDKPPTDDSARRLPGAPAQKPRAPQAAGSHR